MNNNLSPISLDNDLESPIQEKIEVVNEEIMEKEEIEKIPVQVVVKKTYVPFWTEDPNILFQSNYILEYFPVENMSFNQKLNALTRLVIIMALITYIFTSKSRVLVVSGISILCIFFLYYSTKQNEGFEGDNKYDKLYNRHGPLVEVNTKLNQYQPSSPENPLSNVLMSDYDYNPHKKPAPPSFTKKDNQTILEETKKQIQLLNPDQEDISKKLFHDVTENLEFEQSMRQFYSTANTIIPNDQTSFAEFCYGDMISAKEGNAFASVRNNPRYNLY
jgi:hypothetical protein